MMTAASRRRPGVAESNRTRGVTARMLEVFAAGRAKLLRHGHARKGRYTRTYRTWRGMWQRCSDPKATGYQRYGGVGITICRRWRRFENFLADMGVRPAKRSLDRRNPYGNYTPSNCRWATAKQQANNRRVFK